MEVQNPPLLSRAAVGKDVVCRRLKLLVLCQALIGCQSPETLLKDNFLKALVIVIETFPLFT